MTAPSTPIWASPTATRPSRSRPPCARCTPAAGSTPSTSACWRRARSVADGDQAAEARDVGDPSRADRDGRPGVVVRRTVARVDASDRLAGAPVDDRQTPVVETGRDALRRVEVEHAVAAGELRHDRWREHRVGPGHVTPVPTHAALRPPAGLCAGGRARRRVEVAGVVLDDETATPTHERVLARTLTRSEHRHRADEPLAGHVVG